MRKNVYTLVALLAYFITGNLYAQQGTLDSTFNSTGILLLAPSQSHDNGNAIVQQSDSNIVFAGMATQVPQTSFDVLVGRLHPDGSPDSSFGTNGYVINDFGSSDYAFDVDLQPDGKIIVTGASSSGSSNTDFLVMRLNTDGSFDTTFALTGKFIMSISGEDYARASVIQPDGKIVTGGYYISGSADYAVLLRLNTDGTLDTTFNFTGIAQSNFGKTELRLLNLLRRSNGQYVCSGMSQNSSGTMSGEAFAFNSDGSVDSVFGTNGITALTGTLENKGIDEFNNVLYFGGYSSGAAAGYVYALNDTGNYIPSFGTSGRIIVTMNLGAGYNAIKVQPDGKILAGGATTIAAFQSDFLVSRFEPNGTADMTFGTNGHFTADLGGGSSENLLGMALQSDGKILGIGTKIVTNNDIAIVRLDATSSPTGITEIVNKANELQLYPNPANDRVHVVLPTDAKVISIELISVTGSVSKVNMTAKDQIDLGNFAAGLYLLRIQTSDQLYLNKISIQ